MPAFLALAIIGAAAGFLATRMMRLETDVPTTIAIGIVGALIGGLAIRLILALTGPILTFAAAVGGALALLWLWRIYGPRR